MSRNLTWRYLTFGDDEDVADKLPPPDWTVPAYDNEWQQFSVLKSNDQHFPEVVSKLREEHVGC